MVDRQQRQQQLQDDEFLAQQLAACYWEAENPQQPPPAITPRTSQSAASIDHRSVYPPATAPTSTFVVPFYQTTANNNDADGNKNRWNRWQWIVGALAVVAVVSFFVYHWSVDRSDDDPTISVPMANYTTFVVDVDDTPVVLERHSDNKNGDNLLYTLSMAANMPDGSGGGGGGIIPIARNYGYGWERAGGKAAAQMAEWICSSTECTNVLSAGTYFLQERRPVSTISPEARFLEQSTFGVTSELLQEVNNENNAPSSYAEFLQRQMYDVRPTFLREYFRRRANPAANGLHNPEFAVQNDPCAANSYWQRSLFTVRDNDAVVSLQPSDTTTGRWRVAVAGVVRAVLPGPVALVSDDNEEDALPLTAGDYSYCSRDERTRRGEFRLEVDGDCRRLQDNRDLVVGFAADPAAAALEQDAVVLDNLPSLANTSIWQRHTPFAENPLVDEYLTKEPITASSCALSNGQQPTFARTVANEWLLFSPRLQLQENTQVAPLEDGGAAAWASGRIQNCANVPRSIFNERDCRLAPAGERGTCRSGGSLPGTNASAAVLVCGSPGEVSNDATQGDHWLEVSSLPRRRAERLGLPADTARGSDLARQREYVWGSAVLQAGDQLRQRVAWALSQIFALAKTSIRGEIYQTESFLAFYDIFVRNAFGNYLDILREVSYSPIMAENLSYLNSQSLTHAYRRQGVHVFPDENYARELMQLFTIGLEPLNLDGTPASSSREGTYDNRDVMAFARAWTGFVQQEARANVENPLGTNRVDPLRIDPNRRDHFPKTNLYGGYLGDGYPLCTDLPKRPFLRVGAKYRLLGSSPVPELLWSDPNVVDMESVKRLRLRPDTELYEQLCASSDNGSCTFPSLVELDRDLSYCIEDLDECRVETVRVVQVDQLFYEYVAAPCVQLAFYDDGKKAIRGDNANEGVCANPRLPVASEACCAAEDADLANPACNYAGERMAFGAARERCASIGSTLCDARFFPTTDECPHLGLHWTNEDCLVRIKINADGDAAIVHHLVDDDVLPNLRNESSAFFRLLWNDGTYPSFARNNCGDGLCEQYEGDTCLCDVDVNERSVFTSPPVSAQDILALLHVGTFFDADAYTARQESDYRYHSPDGSCCDMTTVFEVTDRIGQTQYLRNIASTVSIGSFASFRNPPHFNSLFVPFEASVSEAQYETEALLEHLFAHENTAPFVAKRLIQRFGISNPSPRYVLAVATAFRDGMYEGGGVSFGSNEYGDMAATVAAVLLDREARSLTLTGDPSHGSLKEPILIVLSFLRAMKFQSTTPLLELDDMDSKIGQMAFEQSSVFSFFSPEYSPPGPISSSTLAAPESQVMSSTRVIGLLNGLLGIVQFGLVACRSGFGGFGECRSPLPARQPSGYIMYDPRNFASSAKVVRDLSILLTSGRLSEERVGAIRQAYEDEPDPVIGLWVALQLIITSPEFHSTSFTETENDPAVPPADNEPGGNPEYKAIIHLALLGGCDSFNVLVPHNSCTRLYNEYTDVRDTVALGSDQVLPIDGDTTGQPCNMFGIHSELPFLKSLYDDGDLLFLANTGILTEPVTRENYNDLTIARLFSHDDMQDQVNTLDPLNDAVGTGVLGRLSDILHQNGFRTDRVAVDGVPTTLAGRSSSTIVTLNNQGVSSLNLESPDRPLLEWFIASVGSGDDESGTLGSLWSNILGQSLGQTGELVDLLGPTSRSNTFRQNTPLGRKFQMIGELISSHVERGVDRDVFFVTMNGFDSHSDVSDTLINRFQELNAALQDLVGNLQAAGLWDRVAIMQTSEFARTLSPNSGEGTDHAWGGNYWITGGAVRGNRILGEYPATFASGNALEAGQRGRLIPTTSWDAVFNGVMLWMAGNNTSDEQLDYVLPNRRRFAKLFSEADLFARSHL